MYFIKETFIAQQRTRKDAETMKKDIEIGGKNVPMSASAVTPIMFKKLTGKDLIKGVRDLNKTATEGGDVDMEFIAQMAWIMAREANKQIEPFEEWLEQFEMFDIVDALGQIMELWNLNSRQASIPAKK